MVTLSTLTQWNTAVYTEPYSAQEGGEAKMPVSLEQALDPKKLRILFTITCIVIVLAGITEAGYNLIFI